MGWFFRSRKQKAFGEHIRTLAAMLGDADTRFIALREQHFRLQKECYKNRKTISSLINMIDNRTRGAIFKNEHPLFELVFNVDDRIAIKRALQLLEDSCLDTSPATAGSTFDCAATG